MQSPTRTQVTVVPKEFTNSKKPLRYVIIALCLALVGGTSMGLGVTKSCRFRSFHCDAWNAARIIVGSFLGAASVCYLVAAAVLYNKAKKVMIMIQPIPVQQPAAALPGHCFTVTTMPAEHPPSYTPPAAPLPPAADQYPPPAGFENDPHPTQAYPEQDTQPLLYCP